MDPDPGELKYERRNLVFRINGCLGYLSRLVDRLVRGSQTEQEREVKTLKLLQKR